MNVGARVNVSMNLKTKLSGMRNAHLVYVSLQECCLYGRTFERNGGMSVRKVGLVVPNIDTLPEIAQHKNQGDSKRDFEWDRPFERVFKELY